MPDTQRFIFYTLLVELVFLLPDVGAAMLAHSLTVWADLWRCGIETLAVFFAWLTIRRVDRAGEDPRGYEYGLGKLESLSTVVVAAIFVLVAVFVAMDAWAALAAPTWLEWRKIALAYVLNALAIVIDGGLWWKHRRLAGRDRSPVVEAQARLYGVKTLADVLVAVVLALSATLRRPWVAYLDPAASLVVAAAMLHSAYGILSESVRDLLDVALDEGLQLQVLRCLTAHFDDYREFHGVRSRRSGRRTFVEVFLEFDPDLRMGDVQEVMDRMRRELAAAIPGSVISIVPMTESPTVGVADRPAAALG